MPLLRADVYTEKGAAPKFGARARPPTLPKILVSRNERGELAQPFCVQRRAWAKMTIAADAEPPPASGRTPERPVASWGESMCRGANDFQWQIAQGKEIRLRQLALGGFVRP